MQNINGKIQGGGQKPLSFLLVALCAFCMAMATSVARAETWVWTGAAEEAEPQWFTAANWADGGGVAASSLSSGDSFTFDSAVAADLEVNYNPPSGDFEIGTVTFAAGSAAVTVKGSDVASITAVVCANGQANEFRNAVFFSDTINVTPTSGYCKFSGGATGTYPSASHFVSKNCAIYGRYNLTSTGTWTISSGNTVTLHDAVLYAPGINVSQTTSEIDANAKAIFRGSGDVTINNATLYSSDSNTAEKKRANTHVLDGSFAGTLRVLGTIETRGRNVFPVATAAESFVPLLGTNRINRITLYSPNGWSFPFNWREAGGAFVLGAGGMGIGQGKIMVNESGAFANVNPVIRCSADYTITAGSGGGHDMGPITIVNQDNGSNASSTALHFDTSDFDDPSVGRTVTLDIYNTQNTSKSHNIDGKGGLSVFGCGAFNIKTGRLVFTGGFAASNGVNVAPGSAAATRGGTKLGNGPAVFHPGTTLTLASASSVNCALGGSLTMNENTSIVYSNLVESVHPLDTTVFSVGSATAESPVNLKFEGPVLADGIYHIMYGSSTAFTSAMLEAMAVSGTAIEGKNAELVASTNGKNLYLAVYPYGGTGSDSIWTGGAHDGKFSSPGNWLGGAVPANGAENIVFKINEASITNDLDNCSPRSITFGTYLNGGFTICGNPLVGVAAVTNSSSYHNIFKCPVSGDAIDIFNVSKECVYLGGITASNVVFSSSNSNSPRNFIQGGWHITGDVWTACGGNAVGNGSDGGYGAQSSLTVDGILLEPRMLTVGSGSAVTAAVVRTRNIGEKNRLCYQNYGEFVVTGELQLVDSGNDQYVCRSKGTNTPVFKFEKLTMGFESTEWFYFGIDGNGTASQSQGTYYIGSGGFAWTNSAPGKFCLGGIWNGDVATIRPWYSDFTIGTRGDDAEDIVFMYSCVFCTDDESGTGRTITIDGKTRFMNNSASVAINGSGKVRLNSMAHSTSVARPVTVGGTATLAIKPGAGFGESAMTVGSGATLEVPESGVVTFTGAATLADASTLSINFTDNNAAPKFAFSGVTASGTVTVKVSAAKNVNARNADGKWLIATNVSGEGSFVLDEENKPAWVEGVSLEGGNLYLNVKTCGLTLSVR